MHFGPKEIGDFLHLLKANEKPSPEEGPDWETILATEVLFREKILRVLRNPAVGVGSLRDLPTSRPSPINSDLLNPGERAARAQAFLRTRSYKLVGPRGISQHTFSMLAPKGDLANLTCQESITQEDYQFTRLWSRLHIETRCDFQPQSWLHTLGRMTRPADVRRGAQEGNFLLNHASGWVDAAQGERRLTESWTETFDVQGDLERVIREGEEDLVFEARNGEVEMKRGEKLEAIQRSQGANHVNIMLPGSDKVLAVSVDAHGMIDELQNLADDGGSPGLLKARFFVLSCKG